MNKIWKVAKTEFSNSVRSKAFLVGIVAMPVMMLLVGGMQKFAMEKKDTTERQFAVVDRTGELFSVIDEAAKKRVESGGGADSAYVAVRHDTGLEGDEVALNLSDQVRDGKLFAFLIIEKGVLSDAPDAGDLRYYTDSPTYRDLPRWIGSVVHDEIQRRRFDEAGLDPVKIQRLMSRVPMKRLGLTERGESGQIQKGEEDDEMRNTGVPMITMLLLFMMLMTSMPTLLTSVMEEKINKISEFLVSAVSPFQLLMGKLIGVLLVSLVLSTLYLGALSVLAARFDLLDLITFSRIAWFYLFLVLGGLMLGSVCIAIGAACSEIRDSQSLMFPVMVVAMFPLLVWMPVMKSPAGAFAKVLSLIPPFTPTLMLLRISIPPGVAVWELVLGVVLTTGFSVLCVMAAGKILRIGILSQGQTPSLAKLVKWLTTK